MKKNVIVLPLLLVLCGCPGGGGSIHNPLRSLAVGQTTTLNLKLSTWGAGSGRITERYTDVCCHYRIKGETNFTTVAFVPVSKQDDRQLYQCSLPAFTNAGDEVEYFIDMKLDGVYNKLDIVTVKVD